LNGTIEKEHNYIKDNFTPNSFDTYEKAWSNIFSIVSMDFINPLADLTIGDRVEAAVVVSTGLGIAFISQQKP
jgi:hypothetical protein